MPLLITSEEAAILAEQLKYDRYQSEVKRLSMHQVLLEPAA